MVLSEDKKILKGIAESDINEDGSVDIPQGVTHISAGAFWKNRVSKKQLTNIIFPEEVTFIGEGACYGRDDLQKITLPKGLKSLEAWLFGNCWNLKSITLPEELSFINKGVCFNCFNLQTIYLPPSVTSIDSKAFYSCDKLQSIILSESITYISKDAFEKCPSVHSIMIDSTDKASIQRITDLLPNDLKDKVLPFELTQEILKIHKTQLQRIMQTPEINPLFRFFNRNERNTPNDSPPNYALGMINQFTNNPYPKKAKAHMLNVPLPKDKSELRNYQNKLEEIANEFISKAKEFRQIPKAKIADSSLEDMYPRCILI